MTTTLTQDQQADVTMTLIRNLAVELDARGCDRATFADAMVLAAVGVATEAHGAAVVADALRVLADDLDRQADNIEQARKGVAN